MAGTLWRSVTVSSLCLCLKLLFRQESITAGQLHTQLVPAHPSPHARTAAQMPPQVEEGIPLTHAHTYSFVALPLAWQWSWTQCKSCACQKETRAAVLREGGSAELSLALDFLSEEPGEHPEQGGIVL